MRIVPDFIDSPNGRLCTIEYLPDSDCDRQHTVVFIPPFAEEMNRSRRMIADQARALAATGFRTVFGDLYGTGDSEGDFSQATFSIWCDNVSLFIKRAAEVTGDSVSVIAIRFGALLLFRGMDRTSINAENIVLWQPCTSGSTYLRQFLRMRIAAGLANDGADRETVSQLTKLLAAERLVEVAGYGLSASLAGSIESSRLEVLNTRELPLIHWFEVATSPEIALSAPSTIEIQRLESQGARIDAATILGDQFWSTAEITTAPKLIDATTSALVGAVH